MQDTKNRKTKGSDNSKCDLVVELSEFLTQEEYEQILGRKFQNTEVKPEVEITEGTKKLWKS